MALFILLVLIAIPSLYDDRMSRTHLGVAKNVCPQPALGPQNVYFFFFFIVGMKQDRKERGKKTTKYRGT